MPDTTQPQLGYGKPTEATIDQVNIWMRGQPWYQEQMRQWGQDPGHPNLAKSQSEQILKMAQSQGVVVDQGNMEVDDHGNFNPVGRKLRNTLIVAGIAGATIATMGAAGMFAGAAGAGAGAGAGGGAATAAATGGALASTTTVPLMTGTIAGSVASGAVPAALATGTAAAGTAGLTGGALASHATAPAMAGTLTGGTASGAVPAALTTGATTAGTGTTGGILASHATAPTATGTVAGSVPSGAVPASTGGGILNTLGNIGRNSQNYTDLANTLTQGAQGQAAGRRQDTYADLNSADANNRAILGSAVFNRDLPSVQTSQVARGDLLSTMHDAAPTGDPRIDKFGGGGLRPSAFGPSTQQAGDALKRQALQNLLAGRGQISPQLTTPREPGFGENAMGYTGTALNILGTIGRLYR